MAGEKEFLKKSLGISEYPWSSDEEDNDSTPQPSISNASIRPFENFVQRATTSTASQFQPTTSTPSTSAPVVNTSTANSSERARIDRNMFWSLVCHPNTTQVDIVQQREANRSQGLARQREIARQRDLAPLGAMSRRPDGPSRPRLTPLRETMELKKTRQITSARNLSYTSLFTGQPRGNHLHIRRNPLFTRRPYGNTSPMCFQAGPSRPIIRPMTSEPQPSTSGAHRPPAAAHEHERRPSELARRAAAALAHQPREPIESIDVDLDANDDDDSMMEIERVEGNEASNSSETPNVSAEMTLEEEVLEVEPAPDADGPRSDDNGNVVEEGGEAPAAAVDAAAADPALDESRGIKRKRDSSVAAEDVSKDDSVEELNQSLLRLLECPVCLEWMEPPMSQCRRGHLVCVKCRSRLSSCPVCRTTFSSVRNRAMEGVAEMLRYPCRHGCLREVRLRRRNSHEASCARRRYPCPAAACAARPPLPHKDLTHHFQSKHLAMVKYGRKQKLLVKVNAEQHDNWIIMALHEIFHLRIDVDIRTWGVTVYVAFVGPKNASKNYMYEVTVAGKHNSRKLLYARATHSDLESASLNVCRQDCFHLSLDQALNFLRIKNRHCETDNALDVSVAIMRNEADAAREDSADS